MSAFGSFLKYFINRASIGTVSNGHISEVAAIGRWPLLGGSTVVLHILWCAQGPALPKNDRTVLMKCYTQVKS